MPPCPTNSEPHVSRVIAFKPTIESNYTVKSRYSTKNVLINIQDIIRIYYVFYKLRKFARNSKINKKLIKHS